MDIVFDDGRGVRSQIDIHGRRPEIVMTIDGHRVTLTELVSGEIGRVSLKVGGRLLQGWRWVSGNDVYVRLAGRHWHFRRAGIEAGESASGASQADVRADMPGTVIALHVAVGVEVAEGDRLLTIESMKLQMILTASKSGRIKTVHVDENASFERGAMLVSFESEADAVSDQARAS